MNKQLEICKERKYLLQFEFDKINNSFFRFLKSRIKKLDYLNKEIKLNNKMIEEFSMKLQK